MISAVKKILFIVGILPVLWACNQNPDATVTEGKATPVKVDSSKTGILKLKGQLFSIPSPIQTAMLIQASGAKFNSSLMNSTKNLINYTTRPEKAMNLGIYGADLGYAIIFGNNQLAAEYLGAVQKLANELELSGALDKGLIKRLSKNIGNRDSMLLLASQFYRAGDAYLKNNNRGDVAALIVAGGWIEAAHLTCSEATNGNAKAVTRLGEQRNAVENLGKVLSNFDKQSYVSDIAGGFNQLNKIYEGLNYKYSYEKPMTYPDQKLTFINSRTSVSVSDSALKAIADEVSQLRTKTAG